MGIGPDFLPLTTDPDGPPMIVPDEALPLPDVLAPVFTRPTYRQFVPLMAAALLATGRRTVANLLRTLGPLPDGPATPIGGNAVEAKTSPTPTRSRFHRTRPSRRAA